VENIEKFCGMSKTIGNLIKEQVKACPLTNKEITDKLNRSENTIYNLYAKASIDTDILLALCEILQYDFFEFFYSNPVLKKIKDKSIDLLIKERDELNEELLRKSEMIIDLEASLKVKSALIKDQNLQILSLENKTKPQ
jgi:hypothetical protein